MAPPWHQLICFPKKITKILTWAPHRQGKRWPLLWYLGAWVVTEAARPTSKIVAWILGGSISLCITGELKWFWVWYGPCSSHWSKSLELGWVRSVYVHGPDLITWLHTSKLLALMSLQAVHMSTSVMSSLISLLFTFALRLRPRIWPASPAFNSPSTELSNRPVAAP